MKIRKKSENQSKFTENQIFIETSGILLFSLKKILEFSIGRKTE